MASVGFVALVAGLLAAHVTGGASLVARTTCPLPPTTRPGDRLVGGVCPTAVQRGSLLLADVAGRDRIYRAGQSGDVYVLGDWDCDGVATPGLYRPDTGLALQYPSWDTASAGDAPAQTAQLASGRSPVVVRPNGRCDEIAAR